MNAYPAYITTYVPNGPNQWDALAILIGALLAVFLIVVAAAIPAS